MDDTKSQVWQITIAGRSVKVESLPLRDVDRIAKQAEVTWFNVVNTPLLDLAIGEELVVAAANYLGVPAPDGLTPRTIIDLFALVPDDVPETDVEQEPDPLDPSGVPNGTPG